MEVDQQEGKGEEQKVEENKKEEQGDKGKVD